LAFGKCQILLCGEWIWPSDKSPEKLRDGIRHLFNEFLFSTFKV